MVLFENIFLYPFLPFVIFVKQLLLNTFSVKTIDNLKKSCYNKTTTKARPQNGQP